MFENFKVSSLALDNSKKLCFWTNSIISVFEVHQNGRIKTLTSIRGKPSWLSQSWGFLVLGYHELVLCQKLLGLFAYVENAVQSFC